MPQQIFQQTQLLILWGLERSIDYQTLRFMEAYLNISLESMKKELQRKTFEVDGSSSTNKLKIRMGDTLPSLVG